MDNESFAVVQFPLLRGKVIGGYSWGKVNMSTDPKFDLDKNADVHVRQLLDVLGLPGLIVRMVGSDIHGPKGIDSILEVTPKIFDEFGNNNEITTPVEFIYTKDASYTLMEKPADCPSCILYAENNNGQKIVGVGHWGRKGTDDLNPHKAIRWLIEQERCNPESIYMGIAPSIGMKHHTLTKKEIFDQIPSKLPGFKNWEEFLIGPIIENGEELYHIDVVGRIKDLLITAGMLEDHIEIAKIDTYEAAEKGDTFSHRYSQITGAQEGRMAIAAALIT